jgi:hypothetical protein
VIRTLARVPLVTIRHRLGASRIVFLTLALLATHTLPAVACSAGPFDPRDHTQLLVLGRARAVELGGRTSTGFIEATVTLDVIHAYRGAAPSIVRFVDGASASVDRDARTGGQVVRYNGGSGACGTLDDDPVGKYVLIALARGDDARWHANRLYGAIYADRPEYAMHRRLLERHGVRSLLGGAAPDAGAFGPVLMP